MLAIDVAFFALELTVGFLVGSLALMADAFHMLNDIISLLVGLWAVSVARKATTDKYTYGWLRAEILGAFFNAVFLIALCVSIVLEALTRFFDPPTIDNPKLILIVGSLGLFSNLVGFFVLGGHGHSHGPEGHDHGHGHSHEHSVHAIEEGFGTFMTRPDDESGPVADVLPEVAVARATNVTAARRIRFNSSDITNLEERSDSKASAHSRGRLRSSSNRHSRIHSIDDMSIHPASFRQEIIAASRNQHEPSESSSSSDVACEDAIADEEPTENSPLAANGRLTSCHRGRSTSRRPRRDSILHDSHNHKKPKKASKKGHGHSHDDMGMNAMILHVIGDALGNVGVIITALIIWLSDWPGKYYADPVVSLFITLIILRSAIPLTSATAKILLQATPDHLDVSEIREDIESLPGVRSCHHIHIWQLSDTKLVASMHIQVEFSISEAAGEKYMQLARRARSCLHEYGIHSATIQPEFCTDAHIGSDTTAATESNVHTPKQCRSGDDLCLLECIDSCQDQGCCPSATEGSVQSRRSSHSHTHVDHQHDH